MRIRDWSSDVCSSDLLVTITGHNFPYERLNGAIRFSCVIDGSAYARHGTTFETRLTVIDKVTDIGVSPIMLAAQSAAELLANVITHVPPRRMVEGENGWGEIGRASCRGRGC